ncbi:ribonuclease H-like domain-containing protein [Tanacetum coccineum]|uniref:Ribonuclease H-like domain-containing protein n=1 Tax=Tanacetum coccineum TaxID=301880 RepID=A0ABQ4ZCP4_9ASTR
MFVRICRFLSDILTRSSPPAPVYDLLCIEKHQLLELFQLDTKEDLFGSVVSKVEQVLLVSFPYSLYRLKNGAKLEDVSLSIPGKEKRVETDETLTITLDFETKDYKSDNNCTVEFDAFGFSVKDFLTHHILLRCDSSGDLYPVTSPSPTPHALLSMSPSTWHQCLGHPGEDVLRSLKSHQYISYNKEKSLHLCHACQLGKHVRLPFTSSDSIITRSFEIVHSDIWTSPIASSGGFKYYVLFLDHYSHYLWIYPLRTKSEVFQKFLHFRSYVNNQFKCDIAAFQCDHGGEFDNTNLLNLFAQNGIQVRFSCPKTSQQNGKSERMIRTINNVIRTLLFQAHLPPTFWVEALHMAAYLLNLLPSSAIQNEIPCTKLFNKQPDYSRLRIFGCLCYPHLHSPHKLAPRATPCIFLGYPAYHRGYRCLDLSTNKIIILRHVTFDELQFPAHMANCNPTWTPVDTESKLGSDGDPISNPTLYRSLAGGFQYLTFTRPDIFYAVQQVFLHMHDPREPYLAAFKRVLRYVRGTLDFGLQLYASITGSLVAYTDVDWTGCPTTRRTTSSYCVFLGDNLLSWSAKWQHTLSRSSVEAEYRGVANVVAKTAWLRNLLRKLQTPLLSATLVYCDNVSAIYMTANPIQHQRTKHIEIDIHFVRDMVALGQVRVLHVPSRYQYADIFTKGLPPTLFEEFCTSLSVRPSPAQTAGAY